MHVLTVIPFSKSLRADTLSYFSAREVPAGEIVMVPLRRQQVPALVITCESAREAKNAVRQAGFALKKISGDPCVGLVDPAIVPAARRVAEWHASSVAAVLATSVAQVLLAKTPERTLIKKPIAEKKGEQTDDASIGEVTAENSSESNEREDSASSPPGPRLASEKLVLQAPRADRIEHYRALARSEFARGGSTVLVAPTIAESELLYKTLRRGIEPYTILLHSSLSAKERAVHLRTLVDEVHPLLIIATPGFLALHRDDVRIVVLEREEATNWRSNVRPFVDFRLLAEYFADERGIRFLLGGEPLRVVTMVRYENGELESFAPVGRRAAHDAVVRVVDTRAKEDEQKKAFSVFSEFLLEKMRRAVEAKKRVILLATRRSLAPITICGHCGAPVLCEFSETPMALHRSPKGNVFVCRACGEMRDAKETCRTCGSWKLVPLGVGIERVEDEVRALFPKVPLHVIERERTKTPARIRHDIDAFYTSTGGILLGTEMMLPYLYASAELAAIVSMDSVLSMPEWGAYERAYSILMRMAESASIEMIVQSRMPEAPILKFASEGDLAAFYKMETDARRALGYPPFGIFIKISVEGTRAAITEELERIEAHIAPAELGGTGRPLHLGGARYRMHGFLRLSREEWPDPALLEKLSTLPPSVTVTIDPSSVL